MASTLGTQHPNPVYTGNLITIEFAGKTIGTIASMTINDDYGPEPVSGIGSIGVYEYPPTMARHTLSVEYAILKKQSLINMGVVPENGCERLDGYELDIIIHDKNSCDASETTSETKGTVLRAYRKCTLASGSFQIQAHRVIMSNATFNARRVSGTFREAATT